MNEIKEIQVKQSGNRPISEQAYKDYTHSQLKQLGINEHNAHFVTVKHLSNSNKAPSVNEVLKGIECAYVSAYEYVTKGEKHLHHWHLITNKHVDLKGVHCEPVRQFEKAVSYLCKQAVIWSNSLYYNRMVVPSPPEPEIVEVHYNDRKKRPQSPMNLLITYIHKLIQRPIVNANRLFISKLTRSKPGSYMKGIDLNQQIQQGYNAAKEDKDLKGNESPFFLHGYQQALKEQVKPEDN